MKPTFQAGSPVRQRDASRPHHQPQHGPATDYTLQAIAPNFFRGGVPCFRQPKQTVAPAFYTLSEGFAAEARQESRLEGAAFAVIAALAAWPLVLAAQAALTLMK